MLSAIRTVPLFVSVLGSHIAEPEHERIWRLACGRRHLRLDRRQRRRRNIALVNPFVVHRNVLERFHRYAEVLGQHLWRGVSEPIGDQQGVEFGGMAVIECDDKLATIRVQAL